jgi:hypothetical protein
MNSTDFQRNFAQSYFGLVPAHLKAILPPNMWESLDLSSNRARIPCTTPNFGSHTAFDAAVILKLGDEYMHHHVNLPWTNDMDQDPKIMDPNHPDLGMIQHSDTCVYLRRHAVRGYNRGHHPRSCNIVIFNDRLVGGISISSPSVIWGVFNPSYYSWDNAILALESGTKLGVVLSRFLGIFLDEGRRYPRIAYRDDVVGFVQNNQPVVYDYTTQDVRDYIFKITGKQVKVK